MSFIEQTENPIPARPESPDIAEDRAFADLVKRHVELTATASTLNSQLKKNEEERRELKVAILAILGERASAITLEGDIVAWRLVLVKEHLVPAYEYQRLTVIPGSPPKLN